MGDSVNIYYGPYSSWKFLLYISLMCYIYSMDITIQIIVYYSGLFLNLSTIVPTLAENSYFSCTHLLTFYANNYYD